VLGCHPGDCHYTEGNYKCQRRLPLTRKLAEQMGVDPRRIRLEWVSASEGARFTQVVTDFTEQVRALGPAAARGLGVRQDLREASSRR